jgi:hypothetical protein
VCQCANSNCLTKGFTPAVRPTGCARTDAKTLLVRAVGVSFERWPPLRGGCVTLKLPQSFESQGLAQLQSEAQHGSAAKAAFLRLERCCPTLSMAPVLAIVWMVAGVVLKRIAARPRWGD